MLRLSDIVFVTNTKDFYLLLNARVNTFVQNGMDVTERLFVQGLQ